jgi:hypothetical protein
MIFESRTPFWITEAEVSSHDDSIPKINMSFSLSISINKKPEHTFNS